MSSTYKPLLGYQKEVLLSRTPELLLAGGIATGKTFTGSHWVINKALSFPRCKILIAANTYSQLMNACVTSLIAELESCGIKYTATLSGARRRIQIGNVHIYLYSLEKPDNIRGIEVEFAWLDEVAFSEAYALTVVRGRLRGKFSNHRQILMTSSLNGYNFLYDIFGNVEKNNPQKQIIHAKTRDNIFLPKNYYDSLLEQYGGEDTPLARQELFGEFVNLQEGAIFNMFDRHANLQTLELLKNYPVYVGIDFNIDKMSLTYNQFINGLLYCVREVQLTHRDANTHEAGQKIINDLKGYRVLVVPDSTGKARKTSNQSSKSDHQILRDLGLSLVETRNPLIRDRQNSMNLAFHKKKLFIDPSCVKTIKEIETLSSRDVEGKVAHLSVTLGYVCWHLMPLQTIRPASSTLFI